MQQPGKKGTFLVWLVPLMLFRSQYTFWFNEARELAVVHVLKMGDILHDLGKVLCSEFISFVFSASVSIHKRF
jgi:hypothetical protein